MALLPLLERLDQSIGRTREVGHAVEAWGAETREAITGLSSRLADHLDRTTEQVTLLDTHVLANAIAHDERLTELTLAVCNQTEAMRVWEDALLGHVTAALETAHREAEQIREEAARAADRLHTDMVLATLGTPAEIQAAQKIVTRISGDARLKAQRPDLRRKTAVGDICAAIPGCPEWRADLLAALCHALAKKRV